MDPFLIGKKKTRQKKMKVIEKDPFGLDITNAEMYTEFS